jgi:serine protease Do
MRVPYVKRGQRTAAALAVAVALLVPMTPAPRAQGTLAALETDVDVLLATTRPSVVTIVCVRNAPEGVRTETAPSTRIGSGVAVSGDEILTTASVVSRASQIWVRTSNRLQLQALVVGTDPISNVALLRVPGVDLPAVRFASSRPARVGDWAITVGTARDSHDRTAHSLGSVAFRHRDPRRPLWQLTNVVYPGFSGAAVVDARGDLIGILQGELDPASQAGIATGERAPAGVSFMLGVDDLRSIYLQLHREGRMHYGYLGVSTRGVSVESESEKGTQVPLGVEVLDVVPGGPAARAGLRRGDMIVAFEGVAVADPMQLSRWVAASAPGSAVGLVWVRDELRYEGRPVLTESQVPVPEWADSEPLVATDTGNGLSGSRIADLERRIERMNRELARLRGPGANSR